MKKSALYIIVLLGLIAIVSAQFDLRQGSEQLVKLAEDFSAPFVSAFFGGTGQFLFEKVLFLVIILSVSYVALERFSAFQDKPAVVWVIAGAVALLATRFLTETQFVKTIILPYTVLGVALTGAIPLIVFFFFTESFEGPIVRRILWIFFVVIFFGLWLSRYSEVGALSWIYFITGILSFFFFLFDGTVRRVIIKYQMGQLGMQNRQQYEREVRRQLDEARRDLNRNIITDSQFRQISRELRRKLKALRRL
ncbi:hypothetical protein HYV49_05480 [Candidatus Pacearchaeota archaeon]|nr:hypothetical protein [Candidatus Pacearchaeota archaeon]